MAKLRSSNFYGSNQEPSTHANGTAIEAECFAYGGRRGPNFERRADAVFPDGIVRRVRCSIADTWFSVPAKARIRGLRVFGYLTTADNGALEFRPYAYADSERPEENGTNACAAGVAILPRDGAAFVGA